MAVVDAVRDNGQPISSTLIRTAIAHGIWTLRRAGWDGGTAFGDCGAGRRARRTIRCSDDQSRPARLPQTPASRWSLRGTGDHPETEREPRTVRWHDESGPPGRHFGDQVRTLEVHLFDFDGELYGATIDVEWVRRLRDVQAFPSRERWWRSSSAIARRRGRPSTGRARRSSYSAVRISSPRSTGWGRPRRLAIALELRHQRFAGRERLHIAQATDPFHVYRRSVQLAIEIEQMTSSVRT